MASSKIHLPDFIFVGAAKAGTTSLYNYLNQHPEISIPIKETFFFNREHYPEKLLEYPKQRVPESICRTIEEYVDNFRDIDETKVVGEIGTGYLFHHEYSIPEIKKTLGTDVKIGIVLRNPVERTFSSYMHFKRFSLGLEDLLKEIEKEDSRAAQGFDFMWQFTGISLYAKQVEAYLNNFENVAIFYYEDLVEHPSAFMKGVAEFLGVDSTHAFATEEKFNPSGEVQINWLQKVLTHNLKIKQLLRPAYHAIFGKEKVEQFRDRLRDRNIRKVGLTMNERKHLVKLFEDDVHRLESILPVKKNLTRLWF
ncbi:MAG: sulfotransferase [Bacteroidota bacterium]